MCTGLELPALATVLPYVAAGGSAISAIGSISAGQAAKTAANTEATIKSQQAQREREIANAEAEQFASKQSALLAKARTLRAGSGVETDTGTSLLTDLSSYEQSQLGEAMIRSGGEAKATRLDQEAQMSRYYGAQSARSGFAKAGATLLTGAGAAFGKDGKLLPTATPSVP